MDTFVLCFGAISVKPLFKYDTVLFWNFGRIIVFLKNYMFHPVFIKLVLLFELIYKKIIFA